MAKRLDNIKNEINDSSVVFEEYLRKKLPLKVYDFIFELNSTTEIIIFSGIIRDFFLKIDEIRDIDIVMKHKKNINNILNKHIITKNQFSGYKLTIDRIPIDFWFLEDTWGLKKLNPLNFYLEKFITETSFFNFSSICYDLSNNKFYYTEQFVKFLRDKEIDIVYLPNYNEKLCIINSIYYSNKLSLPISDNLKEYLKVLHNKNDKNYNLIQANHFGKTLYTNQEVAEIINNFKL